MRFIGYNSGGRERRHWARSHPAAAALAAFVLLGCLVVPGTLGANGERTIALYNVHNQETLRIAYKRNGRLVPEAIEKLNWFLRDWRRDEATKIDPALIDLVWEVHTELGSRVPVHVISSYRSPQTNKMLRETRGGQAKRSQHMLGKAMDVMFPDIPVRRLRYSALLREQGGVGYYPTSATPFVHLDTGRVRHWPRMDRDELALLFPSGRTQHRPTDGAAITHEDAVRARSDNPSLAQRVAAFHRERRNGPMSAQSGTQVAALTRPAMRPEPLTRPAPTLVSRPRLANPAPAAFQPFARADAGQWIATARPKAPPVRMASLSPEMPSQPLPLTVGADPVPMPFRGATGGRSAMQADGGGSRRLPATLGAAAEPRPYEWIRAPEFDEEHPEELYYRPFPIAPFITQTPSVDDAALQRMTHPDINKTLALLSGDSASDTALEKRQGFPSTSVTWSQTFHGAGSDGARTTQAGAVGQPPTATAWEAAGQWLSEQLGLDQQLVQLGR